MSKSVYMRMTIFMVLLTLTSWRVAGQCAFTATAMPGCPGEIGSIQLSLTGVSPWQIAWMGASSGSQNSGVSAVTLSELASGSYSLTVTDGGGCSSTQTVSLVYGLGVTVFTQSQICDISPDGTATGVPYGGLPPYSYLWSNGGTLASQQGLAAGTYTVTVTDERGCTTSSNATVLLFGTEGIWIGDATENVTCFGANDGTTNAMPMSGTPPYNYAWNTGANSMAITNLSAGTYTVTVTDVNGCVGTHQVTITQPPLLTITANPTPACGSASNGSINLTATSGVTPYIYYWSNGANSEDVFNLSAGSYSVTVADANNCTATASSTVLNGAIPTANITGQAQYCSEAAITLLASGGTNYTWNNGTTTDVNIVSGPGTYTVTVSNAQGCTSSTQFTVSSVVTLSAAVTYNACTAGSNGNINLSVSGGQAPYTYVWNNAETAEDLSNVALGTYTVTVTDLNGCTASASYNISNNPLPQVAITGSNVICAGSSSVLTATGGGTYLWSNNATSASITVNVAGTYTVTVTNASGCTATASRTLTVNPSATASITGLSTICAGGTSVFTAGGGGTYLWSTGAVTPAITVGTAGAYTVTVTNVTGCTATASRTLTVNPTPTASIAGTSVICAGGSTTFTAGGGGTYLWSTGATSASVTLNSAGIYTVTVTNAAGCTSSANRIVQVNPLPVVNITGNQVICAGGSSIFTATGGGTYAWSNGATGASITVSTAGTYTVTVTNGNGCTATATRSLVVNPSPTASITGVSTICGSGTSTFTATGGGTYAWSNGVNTASITVGTAGTYTVTVTNAFGCSATASRTLTIGQFPNATISGPSTICSGQTATLVASGDSGGTYLWSIGSTAASISGISAAGTYTVTVTNPGGCTGTASHTVAVVPTPTASISGVLSICAGQTTTLTANGGDTYLWNTSETTPSISVSTPGTYTVTVTSGVFCTATKQVTVGPVIATTLNASAASCAPDAPVDIDITATGGQMPYSYSWNTGQITEDLSNTPQGVYTVTITDLNGCSNSTTSNIAGNPNVPVVTLSQNGGLSCALPTVTLTALPATNASYIWSSGATPVNGTNKATVTAAGTYTVTVTNAQSGCTGTAVITVTGNGNTLDITSQVTNPTCNSGCNGAINITVSGGLTPYNFNWADLPGTTNNPEDRTNLCGGNYSVTVVDANGCTQNATISIIPPILITALVTNPTCFGASNGAIDITVTGGQAPYTYMWSPGIVSEDVAGLSAGTYTVSVTDAIGCSAIQVVTLTQPSILVVNSSVTSVTCSGMNNGSINITVTGGTPVYTYIWSDGSISSNRSNLEAGTYSVTVTDSKGCTNAKTVIVAQPSLLISNPSAFPATCPGMNDGSIHISVAGGTPPYSYIWSDGSTLGNRNNLAAGLYVVTITDANGCTNTYDIEVDGPTAISTQPITSQSCGSTTINASATTGGNAPYTYLWSNAVTGPINVLSDSGNYSLTITDANGCTLAQTFDIEVISESDCAFFAGRVVSDDNNNCLNDAEPGLGGWIVRATGPTNTYYGLSNSDGSYYLGIQGGATYSLEAIPPGALWTTCPPLVLSVPAAPDTIMGADLPVQHPILCPELEVTLASGLVRRCLSGNMYSMSYCNNGTAPAENAYIVLSMDALTTPVSSNLPFTNLGNNNYRFNLGNLAIGQCGNFNVFFNVSCAASLGQTLCASAHIYPDSTCMPINALWSGASLQLSSTCNADSLKFNIKNVGFGPMNEALEYIVVEDHVMLLTAPVQLGSGQSTTIAVPSNGSTWYMSIPQVPYHPGHSMPALAVEGCTPNPAFSTGFVNQFPLDEADPWIDVDCNVVTGSYDPNDKTGFPTGYGEEHYIAPGTALNYLIRFQNTGTDTAFTVLVVDTLSQWLDPATIRAGASSHPYTFDLTGEGIASFLFENIFLPDSNINEAASHGFVQFSILPKITTPLETVLENTAAIYFDLNEPVFTNTTQHRLGEHFITVGLWQPARPQYEVSVTPNPSNGTALISVKGLTDAAPLQLQVVDLYGKVVLDRQSASHQFRLEALDLPEGLYLFRVVQEGVLVGTGKMIIGK